MFLKVFQFSVFPFPEAYKETFILINRRKLYMQSTATLREKKKPESKLEGAVPSRTEAPIISSESVEVMSEVFEKEIALLENRLVPNPLDLTYMILVREPPFMSEEFMEFKKGAEVIPLLPKGNAFRDDLENYAKKNEELPPLERSFINIQILEEKNIAIITNTYFIPPEMRKEAPKFASLLRKIVSLDNKDLMFTANACLRGFTESLEQQSISKGIAENAVSTGNMHYAELMGEISRIYGLFAGELFGRIKTLASGNEISKASILAVTPMQKKLQTLEQKAAEMQMNEAANAFTGISAMERIERGIERGLYSNIEIAMYKQISGDLKAAMSRVTGFARRDAEQRLAVEGYDGLAGWQQDAVEHAIGLVAHLECIAWKVDLADRVQALKGKVHGAAQPISLSKMFTSQHIPMNQFTAESRKEMALLGKRAREHILYLKSFLNNVGGLTPEEKDRYSAQLDKLSKEVAGGTVPGEFSKVSKELGTFMEGVEQVLGERHLEGVAEDEQNPWNVRTTAYTKLYVLSHSLEILGVSTAIGAAAGGVGTRSPAGAWAGAKAGAGAGSLIVAAAGAFVTADAMHRYLSGTGDLEQAIEDMKLGSTYMLFALGGGPIKAISTPVALIAGSSVAIASTVLAWEHVKRGSYFDVAADVAYIAIGSVAFLRVAGGAFRAIRLATPLKSSTMVIANSTGVASVALKARDRAIAITTRAMKVGYSPKWIAMNALFGGGSQWYEISTAIENGNYGIALRQLNRGFAELTRGMVAFDFAIMGVAGSTMGLTWNALKKGAAVAPRYFRLSVPQAQAGTVQLLAAEGLYEEVTALAFSAGAKTFRAKTNAQILELAFASEGKVSTGVVQATLGIESRAAASKISSKISTRWREAKTLMARGKAAGKAAWKKTGKLIKRASKTRAGRIAAHGAKGAALLGVFAYIEAGNAEDKKLNKELARLTNNQELQFMRYMIDNHLEEYGLPEIKEQAVLQAMNLINKISDEVNDGVHPLSLQLDMDGDIEKRKRFLVGGALALIMEGKEPTDKNLSALSSDMLGLFTKTGITLDVLTPVSTVALLGAISLHEGTGKFANAYTEMSQNVPKNDRPAFLDYAVSSYFCASRLGRSMDWASDVSYALFTTLTDQEMEGKVPGWGLVFTFQNLKEKSPSLEQVKSAVSMAMNQYASGAKAKE